MLATPRRAVGETRAEVEVGIPGALKMYIEDLHERGQVLPKPRNVGGYLAAWRPQPAAPAYFASGRPALSQYTVGAAPSALAN